MRQTNEITINQAAKLAYDKLCMGLHGTMVLVNKSMEQSCLPCSRKLETAEVPKLIKGWIWAAVMELFSVYQPKR